MVTDTSFVDQYQRVQIQGVSSIDDSSPLNLWVDPLTNELLVQTSISGTVTVSGTVTANQGGTWNINNISGTVSLPTGAATSANQSTEITHLAAIETAVEGTLTVQATDLDIRDLTSANDSVAAAQSGTWSVTATQATGTNLHTVVDSGTITTVSSVTAIANALPAGNNNIGDVDVASIAAGDNNIGNVDLASAIPAGTNAIGKVGHDITGIGDGRKTVTTGGTAEALAGSTTCKKVDITAETDNTGIVVVGGSSVVAALGTRRGTPLVAGQSYSLEIDNLADIFLDVTVNGDGVTYTYYT